MRPLCRPSLYIAVMLALACGIGPGDQLAKDLPTNDLQFEPDAFWPRQLPSNWILGQVSGLSVATTEITCGSCTGPGHCGRERGLHS